MNTYTWYKIFNLTEFLATELVSRVYKLLLNGIGEKDILVTRGNEVSIVYEDTFLPIGFAGDNPYVRAGDDDTYAIYKDSNEDVWLGVLIQS